jgi:hypothetical protein
MSKIHDLMAEIVAKAAELQRLVDEKDALLEALEAQSLDHAQDNRTY